MYTGQEDDKM